MDVDELQNSNPTVIDVSELPTRLDKLDDFTTPSSPNKQQVPDMFAELDCPRELVLHPFEQQYASSSEGSASDSNSDRSLNLTSSPTLPPYDRTADPSYEPIDEQEIYDLISTISDPEHPISLGSLSVVKLSDIELAPIGDTGLTRCTVLITPTITHCSLATVIGLGVRVRLEQSLPARFRVDVRIKEGTHSTGEQVDRQLGDKERVAAAVENAQLMGVLREMMKTCR